LEARSAQEIWEAALGELQLQVSKPNYNTWLKKTAGLSFKDNHFSVGVPNTFVAEYLEQNQRSLIRKTLIGITQREIDVHFQVDGRYQNSPGNPSTPEETITTGQVNLPRFNPRYTFSSFVVGNSNRLAHTAACTVVEKPGYSYNPLFIYGGVGLGKTHLLHAIGHVAQANHIKVLYVSAEQFTNEFIMAIKERETKEFRNKYRSIDMLLIDDIHFLSGKEQTEQSFYHTFDELHNANRQIVITGSCSPKAMCSLPDQLRSRFEWGLVADIQPPDVETRLAILQTKAEQKGTEIPLDVLEFISRQARQNIRELEGALNRVIAYTKLVRVTPTPEMAARALENIASKQPHTVSITPDLVLEAVASSFQLMLVDLKGRKKDKETALARQVAMYLIRQVTNCSLAQIGQTLGGKNPSTVSHACEKIAIDFENSPYLRHKILEIKQQIYPSERDRSHH